MATKEQLQERLAQINEQIEKWFLEEDGDEKNQQLTIWNARKEEIEFALN